MIRQKFPSAIGSDAPTGRAAKISVQLMTVSLRAIPNCARRQRFSLRQAGPRQSETVFSRSRVVLSHALAKRPARQVLPCGRQKTPPKYLKNNKKSSPGFVLRVVQRIESRSASGYGIGVGEWG
jgi:hypothetical protein